MNTNTNNEASDHASYNLVGPDFRIPEQRWDGHRMDSSNMYLPGSHPPLYGENQFKDGFGPVYAEPTYPWDPNLSQRHPTETNAQTQPQNQGQSMGALQWQQGHYSPQPMTPYQLRPYCVCPVYVNPYYR